MALRVRTAVPLTLAVGALLMLVVAELASAAHVRPSGASPFRTSMVPAFNVCGSPDRAHGTPLAFPSCNPPVHSSNSITVGEPTVWPGTAANSEGWVKLKVKVGIPGPPEDSDVLITAEGTDIRCKGATATCGSANSAGGPDYTGQLEGDATIRITDHFNNDPGPPPGPFTDAATVIDIPFPVVTGCTATGNTARGAICIANTSANATVPGAVKDGKRSVVEISALHIFDGGPDGLASTDPNTLFSVQGVFIP